MDDKYVSPSNFSEFNHSVADEDDPTVGWIKINKNNISHVPNEGKKFESFWKDLHERHSSPKKSTKSSDKMSTKVQRSRQMSKHPSRRLKDIIADSESRIKHFNENKAKSVKRRGEYTDKAKLDYVE